MRWGKAFASEKAAKVRPRQSAGGRAPVGFENVTGGAVQVTEHAGAR